MLIFTKTVTFEVIRIVSSLAPYKPSAEKLADEIENGDSAGKCQNKFGDSAEVGGGDFPLF